jgi:hypothetical protein
MSGPWRTGRLDGRSRGPRLVFGRMHEDWTIELRAFSGRRRIFCIASAGCTALALAGRGHHVHAVDVNPVQVEYVRARLAGAPQRDGTVDRLLALARRCLHLVGPSAGRLDRFLRMHDPAEQEAFWASHVDSRRLRLALAAATARFPLRAVYAPAFVDAIPRRLGPLLLGRLRRGIARHPNDANPYLWSLLRGGQPPGAEAVPLGALAALEVADAAAYLDAAPAASFDGLSLSNVLDGAGDRYRTRLEAAMRRAARPGAVAVVRTFREPRDRRSAVWAAEDRSMLWGAIDVGPAVSMSLAGGT